MIKGDMGKKRFARAQSKYLYQCEEKVSWHWCQPAGIFIVYKLLLLEFNSGRKGTRERAVSQNEVWIVISQPDQIWMQRCKVLAMVPFQKPLAKKQPLSSSNNLCLHPTWTKLIRITRKTTFCFVFFCAIRMDSFFFLSRLTRKQVRI